MSADACTCPKSLVPYWDGDNRCGLVLDCPQHGWKPTPAQTAFLKDVAREVWLFKNGTILRGADIGGGPLVSSGAFAWPGAYDDSDDDDDDDGGSDPSEHEVPDTAVDREWPNPPPVYPEPQPLWARDDLLGPEALDWLRILPRLPNDPVISTLVNDAVCARCGGIGPKETACPKCPPAVAWYGVFETRMMTPPPEPLRPAKIEPVAPCPVFHRAGASCPVCNGTGYVDKES